MTTSAGSDLHKLLDELTGGCSQSFLQAGGDRPVRFRFNRLKHSRSFQEEMLRTEGFDFSPCRGWDDVFELPPGQAPLGKSLAHFMGELYIQDLASMLPVQVLSPRPSHRVLDLCAAPGSKTTQLAECLDRTGLVVANDSSSRRIRSLVFNLRRMGAYNTAVLKGYGEQFGNQYFEQFDAVLLDAPCSALGTLHKSPEVLQWWTPQRSERLSVQQRGLLQSGLKALKPGGVLVYSTCTVVPQENEAVLAEALDQLPLQLETVHLPALTTRCGLTSFRGSRWSPELEKAVRIYPHENTCEGFFIARIRKTESFGRSRLRRPREAFSPFTDLSEATLGRILGQLEQQFGLPPEVLRQYRFTVAAELSGAAACFADFPFHELPVRVGLPFAHVRREPAQLTTEAAHLLGHLVERNVIELQNWEQVFTYANRDDLTSIREGSHQVVVRFRDHALGHGWQTDDRILSRFPRAGWRFGPLNRIS